MCRPISGNVVRTKLDYKVWPSSGSRGIPLKKTVTLAKNTRGLADKVDRNPDYFFILFEQGDNATVRARMHHTQLKGVEA